MSDAFSFWRDVDLLGRQSHLINDRTDEVNQLNPKGLAQFDEIAEKLNVKRPSFLQKTPSTASQEDGESHNTAEEIAKPSKQHNVAESDIKCGNDNLRIPTHLSEREVCEGDNLGSCKTIQDHIQVHMMHNQGDTCHRENAENGGGQHVSDGATEVDGGAEKLHKGFLLKKYLQKEV